MNEPTSTGTFTNAPPQFVRVSERSEWVCYLFGATKGEGISYRPIKGDEPNFFVRWMMGVTLGCRWAKKPE